MADIGQEELPGSSRPVRGSAGRRTGAAARRRARQEEIVAATRALFDERGMRDANIDDIARSVGVNRAIIYRHFASKDELFALTMAEYLAELEGRLAAADDITAPATARLRAVAGAYADFCIEFPAFLDCAVALLRQPGRSLLNEVSDAALESLGRQMVSCLSVIADILRVGAMGGEFTVTDADLAANTIYLQTLGALHLARSGVIVRDAGGGAPELVPVAHAQFRDLVVRTTLAAVRGWGES